MANPSAFKTDSYWTYVKIISRGKVVKHFIFGLHLGSITRKQIVWWKYLSRMKNASFCNLKTFSSWVKKYSRLLSGTSNAIYSWRSPHCSFSKGLIRLLCCYAGILTLQTPQDWPGFLQTCRSGWQWWRHQVWCPDLIQIWLSVPRGTRAACWSGTGPSQLLCSWWTGTRGQDCLK